MATKRTRNYATIVYEESAPENWQQILEEQLVPALISPLHNKDVTKEGEPKKPHYHVMLLFEGMKTPEQAKEVFTLIGGVGCEPVKSLRSYARYLCHLDSKDKHPYDPNDVISLAGANYLEIIGDQGKGRNAAIKEMIAFCRDNDVYSYADLLEYSAENNELWFDCLCNNGTMVLKEYLKSKSWTINNREKYLGKTFIAQNNLESK